MKNPVNLDPAVLKRTEEPAAYIRDGGRKGTNNSILIYISEVDLG